MSDALEMSRIETISLEDARAVTGGMMKLPTAVAPSTTLTTDTGWTWGTVTDLPASEGIGIVIHF